MMLVIFKGTSWNSSTTGHHQQVLSSTQMPTSSSSTLNTSTSAAVRHYSASSGDLKDNIEQTYVYLSFCLKKTTY